MQILRLAGIVDLFPASLLAPDRARRGDCDVKSPSIKIVPKC